MTRQWELLGYTSLVWTALLLPAVQVSAQAATATATADSTELRCMAGWGSNQVHVIPPAQINDGYCDCPFDGADETNTDACSGIDAWPGSSVISAATADDDAAPDPKVTYVYLCCDLNLFLMLLWLVCVVWRRCDPIRCDPTTPIPFHPTCAASHALFSF
jgi:hypothetical protein